MAPRCQEAIPQPQTVSRNVELSQMDPREEGMAFRSLQPPCQLTSETTASNMRFKPSATLVVVKARKGWGGVNGEPAFKSELTLLPVLKSSSFFLCSSHFFLLEFLGKDKWEGSNRLEEALFSCCRNMALYTAIVIQSTLSGTVNATVQNCV